jgi:transcriptional regulator with XRE-family HTH domain
VGLRSTISERQRRLGFELKHLREQAGLSAAEASERIGMGRAQLSQIETAKTTILTERLWALCALYGCTDKDYIHALVALSESSGKGWWSAYKRSMVTDALSLAELEADAREVRMHQSLFIPGLFQTADYARAIFNSPGLGYDNFEAPLRFRMERQRILTGDDPPTVRAVIHEAALRIRFGGAQVVREQLLRLIELSRLPHVTIQVYPFTGQAYAAISGNFMHIVPRNARLGTVALEHSTGYQYLGEQFHLQHYAALYDLLTENALGPIDEAVPADAYSVKDSLALVRHLLYTL